MRQLFYIVFLLPQLVFSQLVTNNSQSPGNLVQNVLLGPGVKVSNIKFTGNPQAIGSFLYNGSFLGLNQGIIMTTGTIINNSTGPQGPNDDAGLGSGLNNGAGGSSFLNNLTGSNNTFNAAVLEFDFTAEGDSVSFNYVFASEEYLEFVGSAFNDVFGLFISGPGIGLNTNIAKLPNQTTVSINNVNSGANSAFYVDNGNGKQAPYNSNPQYIQYDGYTRVLKAQSAVQCGQTYHLAIAIADVNDEIYDSGIFLEAQSLTSKESFDADYKLSSTLFADSSMLAEGCVSSQINLTRFDNSKKITIQVLTAGTATEGLDYDNIADSITFNPGQSTVSFNFNVASDGINEPIEDLFLIFMFPNECGVFVPDTLKLKIQSVEPLTLSLENDTLTCGPGDKTTLVPIVSGGLQPLVYNWSTGDTTQTIDVSFQSTQMVYLTVMDNCLNLSKIDSSEVFVPNIPPLNISPIADITNLCPFEATTVNSSVSGGSGGYTYDWNLSSTTLSTNPNLTFNPDISKTYELLVTDLCGLKDSVNFNVNVTTKFLIPSINTPATICPGDSVLLSASATLGFGNYTYTWTHTEQDSSDVWVTPSQTTVYHVNISDGCKTYSVPIETTATVYQPRASFTYTINDLDVEGSVNFFNTTPNGVSFQWFLGNGQTSSLENPTANYSDIGSFDVTLIAVDNFGCIDTITKTISIGSTIYIPNTFTPDGNRFNNEFFAKSFNIDIISIQIFDRWGELIFEASNDTNFEWDGTYKGKDCQSGTYTYKVVYRKPSREEFEKTGHINLLR